MKAVTRSLANIKKRAVIQLLLPMLNAAAPFFDRLKKVELSLQVFSQPMMGRIPDVAQDKPVVEEKLENEPAYRIFQSINPPSAIRKAAANVIILLTEDFKKKVKIK